MAYIVAARVVAALAILAAIAEVVGLAIEPVVAAAEVLGGRKVESCP